MTCTPTDSYYDKCPELPLTQCDEEAASTLALAALAVLAAVGAQL